MKCNDTSVPCRDYNPCHGRSTCRMRDSGFTCDCPPGKAGRYCDNGRWGKEGEGPLVVYIQSKGVMVALVTGG